MRVVVKKCAYCNKSFDIRKNDFRIALEFRDKKKNFRKEYFCCKECFSDYVKKSI